MERTCQRRGCRATLPRPTGPGRPRRFCSDRCRKAYSRATPALPRELTSRERWVRREDDKRPVRASDGKQAASTWRSSWATYRAAADSVYGVGLGYVLAEGDGIVCIDLDHCLEGGQLAPWAAEILEACPPTFVEVSPSGQGLHLFGHGSVPRGRKIRRSDGTAIEIYSQDRYIAITGQRFEGAPARLADLSTLVADLLSDRVGKQ